jgi:hypothetical protein
MVSIQGDAVLRIRDQAGTVERIILKGNDPLLLKDGPDRWEILHIELARNPSVSLFRASFYVRVPKEPDIRTGEEVAKALAHRLPGWTMTLHLRSDPWFVTERGFPDYHAFSYQEQPPTAVDYHASRTVSCIIGSPGISCYAFAP